MGGQVLMGREIIKLSLDHFTKKAEGKKPINLEQEILNKKSSW
jgi:hypothetical protein